MKLKSTQYFIPPLAERKKSYKMVLKEAVRKRKTVYMIKKQIKTMKNKNRKWWQAEEQADLPPLMGFRVSAEILFSIY